MALAAVRASGTSAATPAFLLDGEPAARLATDLRVVAGRLTVPAVGVLEVVLTQGTADELHLTLGAPLPIPVLAGQQAPCAHGRDRADSQQRVPNQSVGLRPGQYGLRMVLGAVPPARLRPHQRRGRWLYAYDWAQIKTVEQFYSQGSGPNPVSPSVNPPLWQAWWIGTTVYA